MGAKNVDIVFVVDASDSMSPCIRSVVSNINRMLDTLADCKFHVRLDAVIHNVPGEHVFTLESTLARGVQLAGGLYHNEQVKFFTEDVAAFKRRLEGIEVCGDEDMLLALDCALDFPFAPASTTQRVVVLLSDEPFETNYEFSGHASLYQSVAEKMIDKIHARHVSLFMVMPESGIANTLAEADRSDYAILRNTGDGLSSFDFGRFFAQLGKTISVTTAQTKHEKPFERSLLGQADFGTTSSWDAIGDTGGR